MPARRFDAVLPRSAIRHVLALAGLEVRRAGRSAHDWTDPREYIPFADTVAGAEAAGMAVGDYIDRKHNLPGATAATLARLTDLGVFDPPIERVCEIGPGSGRYLEKVLGRCRPASYEIYETATNWAAWLVRKYPVTLRPTDGRTLSATTSRSVDLVHAHKVLPVTSTLTTISYLAEMARIVRPGGSVVFDVMTERCFDDEIAARWLESTRGYAPHGSYPAMMPREYVIDFLGRRGLVLRGSFLVPNAPGHTECMVFRLPH